MTFYLSPSIIDWSAISGRKTLPARHWHLSIILSNQIRLPFRLNFDYNTIKSFAESSYLISHDILSITRVYEPRIGDTFFIMLRRSLGVFCVKTPGLPGRGLSANCFTECRPRRPGLSFYRPYGLLRPSTKRPDAGHWWANGGVN